MYRLFAVVLCIFFAALPLHAETLMVACAANFKPVLDMLTPEFEAAYPNTQLKLISGSSGKLYAQIVHGAPYDVFLSADEDKPQKLIDDRLAETDTLVVYTQGKLVLWSTDAKRLHGNADDLLKADVKRIALANPKLAPYGLAAEQVLASLNVLEEYRPKWVMGESIAQTFQFVATGNAELGFVAKSQVWQDGALKNGSVWLIPDTMYQPIKQSAVVLNSSSKKELARVFLDFLTDTSTQETLENFGYQALYTYKL